MLGLIVSEITNPFFPELVQEFENLAVAQGYEVMIGSTNYDPARTESLIRRMLQRNVDGVAVMTFGIEEELVKKLVESEFPLVFVDARTEAAEYSRAEGELRRGNSAGRAAFGGARASRDCLYQRPAAPAFRRGAARCFSDSMAELGLMCRPGIWSRAITPWKAAWRRSSSWPRTERVADGRGVLQRHDRHRRAARALPDHA